MCMALIANVICIPACNTAQQSYWSKYPLRPAGPLRVAQNSLAGTQPADQSSADQLPEGRSGPETYTYGNPQQKTANEKSSQPDVNQSALAEPPTSLVPEADRAPVIAPMIETTPVESLVRVSPLVPVNLGELASTTAASSTAVVKSEAPKSQPVVRLVISGVRPGQGSVKVAIFTDANSFPQPTAARQAFDLPATNPTLETTLPPMAQFAIAVYQDINSDGELNRNRLGVPVEPFAFSNNAMGNRGPPSFAQAAVIQPAPNDVGPLAFIVPIQLP
jgi:uncharacterized protein (DUF2141 family)